MGGRKKGSLNKNTINYLDLQLWCKMLMDATVSLTDREKMETAFRFISMLLPKIPNIPATPQESVQNVANALGELEQEKKIPQEQNVSVP